MPGVWRTILVTALVAFAAGALGVYAGFALRGGAADRNHGSLDAVIHRELALGAEQDRRLRDIEAEYAVRKRSLEAEMRGAAREIAEAVFEEKAHTARVREAVGRFHNAMGDLQQETIAHVFEMRAVLDARQQARFDEIVRAELLRPVENEEKR